MSEATHYRCHRCAALFPQSEAHERLERFDCEHFGQLAETIETYPICSRCGSSQLAEVWMCKSCHAAPAEQGCDNCDTCLRAADAHWDEAVPVLNSALRELQTRRLVEFIATLGVTE